MTKTKRRAVAPAAVAQQLGVHTTTVQRWIREGTLRVVDVRAQSGRPTYRILLKSYQEFLVQRGLPEADVRSLVESV